MKSSIAISVVDRVRLSFWKNLLGIQIVVHGSVTYNVFMCLKMQKDE